MYVCMYVSMYVCMYVPYILCIICTYVCIVYTCAFFQIAETRVDLIRVDVSECAKPVDATDS